ncbi:hypothetical protein C6Y56_05155 [Pseudomonas fluorescens]|uniref:Uncharacterized protein n=1 Tax=Pseudomonas fluorescens TaxID=294 RepID=A0A7Z3C358_PSEFL|nr:hypothetical protein C6Y56_05155 [Pseudomonas fluorescens]
MLSGGERKQKRKLKQEQEQEQKKGRKQRRQRKHESSCMCFKPEFTSVFHVGVPLPNNAVSLLSLRERVRVRGILRPYKDASNPPHPSIQRSP